MKCYHADPTTQMEVIDCEANPAWQGATFCQKTTGDGSKDPVRSCMNTIAYNLLVVSNLYPNLKKADGCYESVEVGGKQIEMCLCSKDECNTGMKTSDFWSKMLVLAYIIMGILSLF